MENNTTPLTDLPENNKKDSDLVNKILNQLDEIPEESPLEVEKATKAIEETLEPVVKETFEAPKIKKVETIPEEQNISLEESVPSPETIKSYYDAINIDKIYFAAQMCGLFSIMFMIFIQLNSQFVKVFSKIPYVITTIGENLNFKGKLLQSFIFGIFCTIISMRGY